MAELVRNRSSGRQRLRQGYVGKNFTLDGRQYVVDDVIAEGGYAVVLEVRCTSGTNERLALKRVAVNSEQGLFLCRQEIAILKALSDSPHSVTYLASQINKLSKEVFEVLILMQLYGAQSGIQLLRQHHSQGKQLSEGLVLKVFTDVCKAVARLHHRTKPITHRDLKIENVLQDFSGNFVLCDYGSCTTQDMNPTEVGVSQCEEQLQQFTTLPYRAPEMVDLYGGHIITTKSDIWALGCFLYKLCFFDTPFGEQTLAILRGTFSFPETASNYSTGLMNLIKYMLNPDPSERPDIYQVSWVAFKLAHKETPLVNVFNSPIPTILDAPVQLVKPKGTRQQLSPVPPLETTDNTSPLPKRTHTPQPTITYTSISSRERPRSRPLSSVGPGTSSPAMSEQRKPISSVAQKPVHTIAQNTFNDPLPPPVTDIFGQAPF